MTSIEFIDDVKDDFAIVVTNNTYRCYKAGVILWEKEYSDLPCTKINSTKSTCVIGWELNATEVDLLTGEEIRSVDAVIAYILDFTDDTVTYTSGEDEYMQYNFQTQEYSPSTWQEPTVPSLTVNGRTFEVVNSTDYSPSKLVVVDEGNTTVIDNTSFYPSAKLIHVDPVFAIYSMLFGARAVVVNKLTGKYKVVIPPAPYNGFSFSQTCVTFCQLDNAQVVMHPITRVAIRGKSSMLKEIFIEEFAEMIMRFAVRNYQLDLGVCVV